MLAIANLLIRGAAITVVVGGLAVPTAMACHGRGKGQHQGQNQTNPAPQKDGFQPDNKLFEEEQPPEPGAVAPDQSQAPAAKQKGGHHCMGRGRGFHGGHFRGHFGGQQKTGGGSNSGGGTSN